MFRVEVAGLEFYGYHGVPDAERQVGHRYRADIVAYVGPAAGDSDRIEDTVDYVALAREMTTLSLTRQFHTLEAFAHTYATQCLDRFDSVQGIEVSIAKLLPPADIMAASVSVAYSLSREEFTEALPAE